MARKEKGIIQNSRINFAYVNSLFVDLPEDAKQKIRNTMMDEFYELDADGVKKTDENGCFILNDKGKQKFDAECKSQYELQRDQLQTKAFNEMIKQTTEGRVADATLTNLLLVFCTGVSIWTIVDKLVNKKHM